MYVCLYEFVVCDLEGDEMKRVRCGCLLVLVKPLCVCVCVGRCFGVWVGIV